jgi:hypothetical protein
MGKIAFQRKIRCYPILIREYPCQLLFGMKVCCEKSRCVRLFA